MYSTKSASPPFVRKAHIMFCAILRGLRHRPHAMQPCKSCMKQALPASLALLSLAATRAISSFASATPNSSTISMKHASDCAHGDARFRKHSDANIAHTPAAKITTSVQLHHRTRTLPVHATYACTSERELLRSESEGMYALIGAGPMGLAAARNLSKHGVPFQGFELHSDVGGLWDIENPHSTMYESAHLISSKTMTEFKEFPMDPNTATYPDHRAMRDYFRAYAKHFQLYRHFRFRTRVERAERMPNGWRIITSCDGKTHEETFRGLIIANGTLHHPNIP